MNLLATPALLLLGGALVLVALAVLQSSPRRTPVGTLFIWRRVAALQTSAKQHQRTLDPLFWLLLAAIVLGALAASRPAWESAQAAPRVAVFIERLEPAGDEPGLDELRARAAAEAPGAELSYFMAGGDVGIATLNPGTPESELAQFIARTEGFDGRLMFLHEPGDAEAYGRVLPRVTESPRDAMFEFGSSGAHFKVRTRGNMAPQATGATLISSDSRGGETLWQYEAAAAEVALRMGARELKLKREPFVVGAGTAWVSDAHKALFSALRTDPATLGEPKVWLGSNDREPALRINAGNLAIPAGAGLSMDTSHPIFADLPLEDFEWLAGGKIMAPDEAATPLLAATLEGKRVGDLVRLRGRVLEFAADPFTQSPVTSAALLLDNAIGVLAGTRPSGRPGYGIDGAPLPNRRAALSAPFAPTGNLDLSSGGESELEFASWLLLAASIVSLTAGYIVRRAGVRRRE